MLDEGKLLKFLRPFYLVFGLLLMLTGIGFIVVGSLVEGCVDVIVGAAMAWALEP